MDLKQILCPVDFSELSAAALRYASELAECRQAHLIAAHAAWLEAPAYFTLNRIAVLEEQFRHALEDADAALVKFAEEILGTAAQRVECRVIEGLPVDGIRRLALDAHADLVVMGTHGRTGINHLMLGSVAERVLLESPAPVMTVRGAVGTTAQFRRVVCAVNGTDLARRALRYAAGMADCFGPELIALHVREHDAHRDIADLEAWLRDGGAPHCDRAETREGKASEQIIRYVRENAVDLVVVGAQHSPFFDATVFGSTTVRVVRHAPCPVLTVVETAAVAGA